MLISIKLYAGSDVQHAAWGQKQRAEGSSYANWMTLQKGKMAKFCKDFVHLEFLYTVCHVNCNYAKLWHLNIYHIEMTCLFFKDITVCFFTWRVLYVSILSSFRSFLFGFIGIIFWASNWLVHCPQTEWSFEPLLWGTVLSVCIRGLLSLLFFDTHIKQIFSTCFSYIKNIIKLRCTVSNEELKILNNASILPLIDYVIHYFPHSMNLPWISCR